MRHYSLYLVRHGATEWSVTGQHTGLTDIPLTDNGVNQAISLKPYLSSLAFTAVFSSPLSRAKETARLGGYETPTVLGDLVEWDYGAYEGLSTQDIRLKHPGWDIFSDGVKDGERINEVGARCDRVLTRISDLAEASDSQEPLFLLFAHGHVLRILIARWLGLPSAAAAFFHLDPATISVLGYEHERAVIAQLNSRPLSQ